MGEMGTKVVRQADCKEPENDGWRGQSLASVKPQPLEWAKILSGLQP
jgi:hypothetical protein